MSKIERYWEAVKKRVDGGERIDDEIASVWDERAVGSGVREDEGAGNCSDSAVAGTAGTAACRSVPNYYFYRSIRHRRRKPQDDWGIFIISGGRDDVASLFRDAFGSESEARDKADEFLTVCGTAHYRFDVYAMSCEAILGRWLYLPFQKESESAGAVRFEDVYVVACAMEWAARNGVTDAVGKVIDKWTSDTRGRQFSARRLGAYLSTALLDNYASVVRGLRFDQAEWVSTIPRELELGCPPSVSLVRELPCSHEPTGEPLSAEQWFQRWGVSKYERGERGGWVVNQDLWVVGEIFENGRFPLRIEEVHGDFVCVDTNISSFWQTLPGRVTGNVNLSSNRHIKRLSAEQDQPGAGNDGLHGLRPDVSIEGFELCISVDSEPAHSVPTHVLSLFKIRNLQRLVATYHETRESSRPITWVEIVNEYLHEGKSGMMRCQTELIKAGFKDQAKL
ncbi:hypothetical protein C2L64_46200 [Paraburkholderia hospita]|uniref:Uncharacterized protein n=1 Tax=Paraburkholderia hospita TaxID=169430 RepID=A0AAN1JKJ9_9BURK|nr:hypothetical protein [Paraburkholderia hospita]AUT75725.1 hypothetical protein C2L64_46200 [Paraburkholderia hospita]